MEISCLPADLPEFIQVDVADLEVGHSLHLSDLPLPADVILVALTHGEDRDISVVSVQPPRAAKARTRMKKPPKARNRLSSQTRRELLT